MTFFRRKKGVTTIVRMSYNTDEKSWKQVLREVIARDGNRCTTPGCTGIATERHHIVPLSRGGTNSLRNIVSLCQDCHSLRHKHLHHRLEKNHPQR